MLIAARRMFIGTTDYRLPTTDYRLLTTDYLLLRARLAIHEAAVRHFPQQSEGSVSSRALGRADCEPPGRGRARRRRPPFSPALRRSARAARRAARADA